LLDRFFSKTPNERGILDFVDMRVESTHKHIFSVVDNFLGFLWTRKLLNRTAKPIINNLDNIIETIHPKYK
jgi:hypothetical protein